MIRFGLVGTNTSHAPAFASIINGTAERAARVSGGKIVAVWGDTAPESRALEAERNLPDASGLAKQYAIDTIVAEPTDMIGMIDAVLVVDDLGLGARHGALARSFIDAGIPTYIDKPMTLDLAEATQLFDLAEQRGAPLFSASALRFAHELEDVRRQLADQGAVSSIVSVGPGDWFNYAVHTVEMYQTIIGPGARWLQTFSAPQRDITVIGYDNGPNVIVQTLRDSTYAFHVSIYAAKGRIECDVTDFDGFYTGMMEAMLNMVRTGIAPVSRETTLEILAMLHAGLRSAETGERIQIADMYPR